jgi:hypothetical protein
MKFLYSLTLTITSIVVLFWAYIFCIPAPKLYLSDSPNTQLFGDTTTTITKRILEISKIEEKGRFYHFDPSINKKRNRPIVLYTLLTTVLILIASFTLKKRAHVGYPIIFGIIGAYFLSASLWIFTNSISENIYLDIQSIREIYFNVESLQFLGTFVFIEAVMILIGLGFKFPSKEKSIAEGQNIIPS